MICVQDVIFGVRELLDTYPTLIYHTPTADSTCHGNRPARRGPYVRVLAVNFLGDARDDHCPRIKPFDEHCCPSCVQNLGNSVHRPLPEEIRRFGFMGSTGFVVLEYANCVGTNLACEDGNKD